MELPSFLETCMACTISLFIRGVLFFLELSEVGEPKSYARMLCCSFCVYLAVRCNFSFFKSVMY